MARARNIKPGFFKNYDLADLGPYAQLLFAGLWCLADKEGRLKDQPRLIKAEIFPYYDVDVNGELTKLERLAFIDRYEVDGIAIIQIANFVEHQSPHHTEKASTLPSKCSNQAAKPIPEPLTDIHGDLTVNPRKHNGGNPPDSPIHRFTDSLIPDSPNHESKKAPSADYTQEFEDAWIAYPDRPGASKKESFKAWSARIKAGASAAEMLQGVVNYAAYVKAKKVEPEFIKQPATFFGPSEHFKSDWSVNESNNARASPSRETIAQRNERIMAEVMGRPIDDGMTIEMGGGHG